MRGTTDPVLPSTPDTSASKRRRLWIGLGAVGALVVAAFAVWFLVLRTYAPEAVDLGSALDGVTEPAGQPAEAGTATGPATAFDGTVAGTWTVDRTITNAEGTGSFGGFRVEEELVSVGAATAVGRSRQVEGSITVEGTSVTAASITVDLTAITSNESRRNNAIQQALNTRQFPKATFVLTRPVSVASVPAEGERIDLKATGDLTIKGVTKPVTVDLSAQLQRGVLVAVGSAPVTFADFGVRAPTAPVVASVDDHGVMEFQLYFTKK